MTAPSFLSGFQVNARTGNGTSLSVNVPSTYQAGDEIFVVYVSDGDGDVATITQDGNNTWTKQYDVAMPNGVGNVTVWHRTAVANEGTTYATTNTVSERAVIGSFAIRNYNGIHATATTSSGTAVSVTAPSLTTTIADTLRITIYGTNRTEASVGTFGGHTKGPEHTFASAGTMSVQYKALASATTDSPSGITQSATGSWDVLSFAIAPTSSASANGTLSSTLGAVTATSSTGTVSNSGTASTTLGAATLVATGTVVTPSTNPTLIRTVVASSVVGGTTVTIPVPTDAPTIQEGDLLIAVIVDNNDLASITPDQTGWTELWNAPLGTHAHTQSAFIRYAPASLPADYTFTISSGEWIGALIVYRNALIPGGTLYDHQVNDATTTAAGAPGLTTTVNSMSLWFASSAYGTTWSPPASYTEIIDHRTGTGSSNISFAAAEYFSSSAGATLTPSGTSADADWNIAGHLILSQSGTVNINGTLTKTLDAVTGVATATAEVQGSLDSSLGALTGVATGTVATSGTSASTLGAFTASSAGTVALTGTLSKTLGDVTGTATATADIVGNAAVFLDVIAAVAAGLNATSGTADITLDAIGESATGEVPVVGQGTAAIDAVYTDTATGAVDIVASADRTLGALVTEATGVVGSAPITGESSVTLGATSLSASGGVSVQGSATLTLAAIGLSATSSLNALGAASITLDAFSASSAGTVATFAALATTLGAVSSTAEGDTEVSGQATIQLGAITPVSLTGTVANNGEASIELGAVSLVASSESQALGVANITLGLLTVSAQASNPVAGTANLTLGELQQSLQGAVSITGLGQSDVGISVTASGIIEIPPDVSGVLNVQLGLLTSQSSGVVAFIATVSRIRGPGTGRSRVSSRTRHVNRVRG